MILVTGATGNVGRNVVRELLDAGEEVRALTRNPAGAGLPDGVEVVRGDFAEPAGLAPALRGVDRVFLFPAWGLLDAFLGHAVNAGVQHVVLMSSASVAHPVPSWIGEMHEGCERSVRDSGLSWTFVRPGGFMANDLNWSRQIAAGGTVHGAYGQAAIAPVDERDIAAVAARTLLVPRPGAAYELTGGETLSQIDRVRIIGETLGIATRWAEEPREVIRSQMVRHMPGEVADFLLDLMAEAVHNPEKPLPTVQDLTGRPAHTYEDWVAHRAASFTGPAA